MAFTGGVFVGHQVLVNVGFRVARARLAALAGDGTLIAASRDAYGTAVTGPARPAPPGPGPARPELAQVQVRDLVVGAGSAVLTLRWQAAGPRGALVPVLDADVRLAPMAGQVTALRLDGAYRPPRGAGPDRAALYQAAVQAVQAFLGRIAEAIADPVAAPGAAASRAERGAPRPPALP